MNSIFALAAAVVAALGVSPRSPGAVPIDLDFSPSVVSGTFHGLNNQFGSVQAATAFDVVGLLDNYGTVQTILHEPSEK